MTGCTCTKRVERPPAKPNVKLLWNPDCAEHGIESQAWTERVTSEAYRERANRIVNKLAQIKEDH